MQLKGVLSGNGTHLTAGAVDTDGTRKVVRYCLDGGVHGVAVLGSSGEFPAMTDAMRQAAIETVLDEVQKKVPVLIGCGETGTKKTIAQVRRASQTDADAVLVALPYYYPLDQAAVIRHYLEVADASELPVVMYNFPQMTKSAITPASVEQLAIHPNIIGLKDSSGDFFLIQRFIELTNGADFAVMCGNPALGLAAYLHGAKGGIYAGCSLAPKLCAALFNAFESGDIGEALKLQKMASNIPLMANFGTAAAVIKFALDLLGICGPEVSAPLGLAGGQEEKILDWMGTLGINK